MEHEMTVEHDDDHTQKGYQRTKCLNARDLLRLAEEQGKEQHGKERTGADDKRGVRRRGEEHRRVLRQEIHGAASETKGHHQELVTPGVAEPALVQTTPNPS